MISYLSTASIEDFQPMKKPAACDAAAASAGRLYFVLPGNSKSNSTSVVIYEFSKSTTIGPDCVKPTVVNEFESTGLGAL